MSAANQQPPIIDQQSPQPAAARRVGDVAGDVVRGFKPLAPEESAAWRARAARDREAERQDKVKSLIAQGNLPKRQWGLAAAERGGHWGQAESKLRALRGTGFSAALVGLRGTGKSQLGVELIRHGIESVLRHGFFVSLTELFMQFKEAYKKDSALTELEIVRRFRKPGLLVIDECSKIAGTDWELRTFFELLNKRYEDQTDTLLIANMPAADFEQFVGPSLASRMRETGGILECDWPPFR